LVIAVFSLLVAAFLLAHRSPFVCDSAAQQRNLLLLLPLLLPLFLLVILA
jgi:hypothetical protein